MLELQHRHDISDKLWNKIKPLLSGTKGKAGRNADDNRRFINGVMWILRTGAPWRDLPESYGDWKNTHRRFCRWRDRGAWEDILDEMIEEPDFEWLMIDVSHVKVQQHAARAIDENEGGSIQRYIWPWMRMVCRSESLLQRVPLLIAQKLKN